MVFMEINRKGKGCVKPQESKSKDLRSRGREDKTSLEKMKGTGTGEVCVCGNKAWPGAQQQLDDSVSVGTGLHYSALLRAL